MENILDSPSTEQNFQYAGFWIRVGSTFIDGILLLIVNVIVSFLVTGSYGQPSALLSIIGLVLNISYYCGLESSAKQATLGKMALGIKVGDMNGDRISFANALGRYFSKIISAIILFIGFMMVGWDDKKQGLHDKIANTYVYYV